MSFAFNIDKIEIKFTIMFKTTKMDNKDETMIRHTRQVLGHKEQRIMENFNQRESALLLLSTEGF